MRITSGNYKNKKLYVPDGNDIRPTSDRMRLALFNILRAPRWDDNFDLNGARVLDLFCGTGALGLEALSNGASYCMFIDHDIFSVQRNTAFLENNDYRVVKSSALHFGKGMSDVNLVFLDPPYGKGLVEPTIQNLIDKNWLADRAIIVVETESKLPLNLDLELLDTRTQSQSDLRIFRYNATIK